VPLPTPTSRRIHHDKAVRLLDESLAEERGADLLPTEITEGRVNREAAS